MNEKQTDVMTRVNHAGEYGAVRIYQGQSAAIGCRRWGADKNLRDQIDEMAAHERVHLDYFEQRIAKKHSRPTLLLPLWHIGGFALGAMTARLGRKAAFACTQAVEEVIDEHYTRQIELLGEQDNAFREKLLAFRDDERAHHDLAQDELKDEESQTDYPVMRFAIASLCRVAIALSSRI